MHELAGVAFVAGQDEGLDNVEAVVGFATVAGSPVAPSSCRAAWARAMPARHRSSASLPASSCPMILTCSPVSRRVKCSVRTDDLVRTAPGTALLFQSAR
ncbi:hypothetical protein [Luteococcus sediminum]